MRLAVIGNSHMQCMVNAYRSKPESYSAEIKFLQLSNPALRAPAANGQRFEDFDHSKIEEFIDLTASSDLTVLVLRGNEHAIASLINTGQTTKAVERHISSNMQFHLQPWLQLFQNKLKIPAAILPPPPPIESEDHIRTNPSAFREKIVNGAISPVWLRLHAWRHQVALLRRFAARYGFHFIDLPPETFSDAGCLEARFTREDPTHGNTDYGELLCQHLCEEVAGILDNADVHLSRPHAAGIVHLPRHPYDGLPDSSFWRESVASVERRALDPVVETTFRISRDDKVATAGSCFAQHISKWIKKNGFNFLVTESPPFAPEGDAKDRGYYDFSARYGNVYTSRQLLQLFDRAYGCFRPIEDNWQRADGRLCDPFRPRIESDGFDSIRALRADRNKHLAAVRQMFERLDVLVFTLGLTECWTSRLDGAAFPIAPGVAGGIYNPQKHCFVNLSVEEVCSDLKSFLGKLRLVNPAARVLLTVSPVPLAATYEPKHVLVSTSYSKSVLRVAADMIERSSENVFYFPSYEIITGSYNRGAYFHDDLRTVTDEGVSHVMEVFMRRIAEPTHRAERQSTIEAGSETETETETDDIETLADAACDEALLGDR